MSALTYWYLEFEAYKLDGQLFVKEIALLKGDRTQCWTYYIHQHAAPLPTSQEYLWQKSFLGLAWSYGDHSFQEAIELIKSKVAEDDLIFVSDPDAALLLKQYLPKITFQPCEMNFEMLYCPSENCDIRHGDQCARRKVHELRYHDNHDL